MNTYRIILFIFALSGLSGGAAHAQIEKEIARRSIPSSPWVRALDTRSEMSLDEAARLTRRSEFSNVEMQMITSRSEYSGTEMRALNKRSEPGQDQARYLRRYINVQGITSQSMAFDGWMQQVRSRSTK